MQGQGRFREVDFIGEIVPPGWISGEKCPWGWEERPN
jgi:hypothetical protein